MNLWRICRFSLAFCFLFGLQAVPAEPAKPASAPCPAWLDHDFTRLHSSDKLNLCQLVAGRPALLVNTASHCGFTPQFKGLQMLHQQYSERGLVIVGFASNDFDQEDADQGKAAQICYINYGVKFTMLAPTAVKGDAANPVFRELARQTESPGWNFNKYLVSADGRVVAHYDSRVTPEATELHTAIEGLLAAPKSPRN